MFVQVSNHLIYRCAMGLDVEDLGLRGGLLKQLRQFHLSPSGDLSHDVLASTFAMVFWGDSGAL